MAVAGTQRRVGGSPGRDDPPPTDLPKLDKIELSVLDALDERAPLVRGEAERWAVAILGVTHGHDVGKARDFDAIRASVAAVAGLPPL